MPSRNFLILLIAGQCLTVTDLQARELPFELDLSVFQAVGNQSRLEVYLGIDRRQITYERERGRDVAHLAGVILLKQRGQIIDFKEMAIEDVVDHLDNVPPDVITKQATFNLTPGRYDLQVVVEDRQGNRSDSTLQVEVPAYEGWKPELSAIQLSRLVRRSVGPKEFFKRGLTVWPNPGGAYDNDWPLLWHYAEVYGLTPLDTVEIRTAIWRDSTEVLSLVPRRTPSPSVIFSDWGAVNLSALAEGHYRLALTITVYGDTLKVMKPFRIVREAPVPADSGDILADLSAAELTDVARGLGMLQPELDIRRFRAMDSTDQRQLVRDTAGKVAHGLAQDSSLYLAGLLRYWNHVKVYDRDWRSRGRLTEQGRTIFLYGLPATIETYPATSALREYQVWTFAHPDSTAQFVFMDREGYGEFTLVHATVADAVQNENWRSELFWVPVPMDTMAPPAAKVEEEGKAPPPVDTTPAEPAMRDTLPTPELDAVRDTIMVDTSAVQPVAPDTAIVDTPSVDSSLREPVMIDTARTP